MILKEIKNIWNPTFILKNDGILWGCGANSHGQLGLRQNITYKTTLTQITTNTSNIESAYCGYYYTFILKNELFPRVKYIFGITRSSFSGL